MAYKLAILSLLALQAYVVSSGKAPCACARNFKLVCGSDGKTYSNPCTLECHNYMNSETVTVAHEGECNKPCICTYEYKPVCGSDGNTYPNSCALSCEQARTNIEMKHEGECLKVKTADISCTCTEELNEVCATNGLTYANNCLFNCAAALQPELKIAHEGRCPEKDVVRPTGACACPRSMKPVCGSDGKTYNNECLMKCAGVDVTVAKLGACDS